MDKSYLTYLKQFRRQRVTDFNVSKFVMLCGKKLEYGVKDNRLLTKDILANHRRDIFIIYSEDIFDVIKNDQIDLLKFEEILVEISDGVIIFLESFGTAAELGAFAYLDNLAKKILVFVDMLFKNDKSFINTGPLSRIQILSGVDEQVIYAKLLNNKLIDIGDPKIFSKITSFIKTEKNISFNKENFDIDDANKSISISPQLLIYLIIDIVFVLDFIPRENIYNIICDVLGKSEYSFIIKLHSNNSINPDSILNYFIEFLIKWKILTNQTDKKEMRKELISINYRELNSKNIHESFGKILFTKKMFENRDFLIFKLRNRKINIDKYGEIYGE